MKNIIDSLKQDLKEALKAQHNVKKSVYRFILSAIHNEEIKIGKQLNDEEVMKLLIKQAQQRKDSIEAFTNAKRSDLVDKESEELEIISKYLPEQISEEKIKELAQKAIQETNAESVKDLGKIMPILMKQLGGQADGKTVNKIVMELLN
ncbi:GatB/YqeY domain-containing protein [Chloroflexi bacterium]|nr:GatB/YqeY domain-containing protein [Chloroflexota bacterium]|tara:strand:+ start:400 stop:846 length:447 start_codon:yes stop_codon:yes gene_type:complete